MRISDWSSDVCSSDLLDGENERLKAAGGQGLIAPAFLIDKAVTAMEATIADAKAGGSMVESLVRRTGEAKIAGDWDGRAAKIVQGPVAAALERQLAELKAQRPKATMDAGMWEIGRASWRERVCKYV